LKESPEYLFALKSGNEKAFKMIMDHWYSRLFNFANGYLNNQENAKEILQDVFLVLWDHRNKLMEGTNLNAYLINIIRRRVVNLAVLRHIWGSTNFKFKFFFRTSLMANARKVT
jgi:DNA-directed RNA polymerase specialized sigma24 family protein